MKLAPSNFGISIDDRDRVFFAKNFKVPVTRFFKKHFVNFTLMKINYIA